jgi:hypothetical protein
MSDRFSPRTTRAAAFHRQPHVRLLSFLTVIVAVLVAAVVLTAERLGENGPPVASLTVPGSADQTALRAAYEQQSGDLTRAFAAGEERDAAPERLASIATTRDELLALTVPTVYKDLHLQLIIALSHLEAGYGGDADRLEAGRQLLREARAAYPWLGDRERAE